MFKFNRKILFAALSLALFFGVSSTSAQQSNNNKSGGKTANCPSDADTVKAIYDKIRAKYAEQTSHINVRIENQTVTLEGWVTTRAVKKEIERYARKTSCVKKVDNQLGIGIKTGCGPGQVQCGDICISEGKTCNICRPGEPGCPLT